jgi:protein tyrosine phosphatase (PTP) superfamily phosphohydrolase (DUF442 family)
MSEQTVADIYNFLALSDAIGTAGQPLEEQFSSIENAGYQVVINLALSTSPQALPYEKEIVEKRGMEYIHIPVIWENPRVADAFHFFDAMNAHADKKIFVHCAANKRVSAFMYLYRTLHLGISQEDATRDLHQLWIPNEGWNTFINQVTEQHRSAP